MGIYDRDYMTEGGAKGGPASWSMVTWLLIVNTLAFILQHLVFDHASGSAVELSKDNLFSGQVWRLLTYQFCHEHPGHFLGNMIGLFFVGRLLERFIGGKLTLAVYLLGGIAGGFAHILFGYATGIHPSVIGASGAVFAVLAALIAFMPEQEMNLFFLPFRFKLKYIGWFALAFNAIGLALSFTGKSGVSYSAHLGGMALGWYFVRTILPSFKDKQSGGSQRRIRQKRRSKSTAKSVTEKSGPPSDKESDSVYLNKKVDAILEKISEQGMQSLTPEERKILEKSSEKLARKLDDK